MITKEEVKKYREHCKQILDYKESRYRMECSTGNFLCHNRLILDLDPENLDKQMEMTYKMVFQRGWAFAERLFRNAEAAEIHDIDDNINDVLRSLRLKKKDAMSPDSVKAYNDSINIVKELKTKLPKRLLRI